MRLLVCKERVPSRESALENDPLLASNYVTLKCVLFHAELLVCLRPCKLLTAHRLRIKELLLQQAERDQKGGKFRFKSNGTLAAESGPIQPRRHTSSLPSESLLALLALSFFFLQGSLRTSSNIRGEIARRRIPTHRRFWPLDEH